MTRKVLRNIISTTLAVLGPLVLFDAIIAATAWYFRIPKDLFLASGVMRMRYGYLMLCSGAYGVARVGAVHPIFNTPYRKWLTTTPWRRGLPLPLGEVSLTIVDAAGLAVLVAVAGLYLRVAFWLPLVPFLAGYVTVLTVALASSGERKIPAVLWGGLMVAVLAYPNLLAVLVVLLALLPLAWWNWWQSQLRFPWGLQDKPQLNADVRGSWARVGPRKPPEPIPLIRSTIRSFLIALTLYALLHHAQITVKDLVKGGGLLIVSVGAVLALVRLFIYCAVNLSPMSLWGRIWMGRLIIPGYDYVLLAPLAMVLTSATLPFALLATGLPPDLCICLAAFAVMLIGFAAPPTRCHWELTGSHRISLLGQQQQVQSTSLSVAT
jgi:hypothetical protein